jgi:hypothetical protein
MEPPMFTGRQVSPLQRLAATAALALFAPFAAAQDAPLPVRSIDLYRSAALDSPAVLLEIEPDVTRYAAINAEAARPNANIAKLGSEASAIESRVRARLEARVPLAFFEIHTTVDFGPPPQMDVTIDVVELQDIVRRMPFRATPTGMFDDPDGLLAAWDQYTRKVYTLAMAGAPLSIRAKDCPVLHCIAPFNVPELAPYLERFDMGARRQEDRLYRIAAQSADPQQRADALFLLAHTNDAQRLLPVLTRAIRDGDSDVRNSAMRMLAFMAEKGIAVDYPVRDLVAALDFPASSDRNKAGIALSALADDPKYRDTIRAEAVPVALRLLRQKQPNNHGPAYEILKKVSGESFGDRDYDAWERWAASLPAPQRQPRADAPRR